MEHGGAGELLVANTYATLSQHGKHPVQNTESVPCCRRRLELPTKVRASLSIICFDHASVQRWPSVAEHRHIAVFEHAQPLHHDCAQLKLTIGCPLRRYSVWRQRAQKGSKHADLSRSTGSGLILSCHCMHTR